jgi:hypothetical protein
MPKVNNHPIGKKYDQSSYDDVMITILGVIANFLQKIGVFLKYQYYDIFLKN